MVLISQKPINQYYFFIIHSKKIKKTHQYLIFKVFIFIELFKSKTDMVLSSDIAKTNQPILFFL